ncbi:hypothetical protein H5410_039062 [Solanum commersonii]|uniref:Phytocyanin domain-containing protein n=1 Tax=Solanum commersonii TaxID=4109 RepID=A0A9J5YFN3_SOLCO|nr:hypothetical protein H5410_039062 [Solanum commersonii]
MAISKCLDFLIKKQKKKKQRNWIEMQDEKENAKMKKKMAISSRSTFNYSADKDSVLLVNKADFDNCNTASPIDKYSDGHG